MKAGDKYRYFKGGAYTFLMFAYNEKDGLKQVVYQCDRTNQVLVSPAYEFFEELEHGQRRFRHIPEY